MNIQGGKRASDTDFPRIDAGEPETLKRLKSAAGHPEFQPAQSRARIPHPSQEYQSSGSPHNLSVPASFATVPNVSASERSGEKAMRDALAVLHHLTQNGHASRLRHDHGTRRSAENPAVLGHPAPSRHGFGPYFTPAAPPRPPSSDLFPASTPAVAGQTDTHACQQGAGLSGFVAEPMAGLMHGKQAFVGAQFVARSKPPAPRSPSSPKEAGLLKAAANLTREQVPAELGNASALKARHAGDAAIPTARHACVLPLNPFPPWQSRCDKGHSAAKTEAGGPTSAVPLMCGGWPVLTGCSKEEAGSSKAGASTEGDGGEGPRQQGRGEEGVEEETRGDDHGMGLSEFLDGESEFWEESGDGEADRRQSAAEGSDRQDDAPARGAFKDREGLPRALVMNPSARVAPDRLAQTTSASLTSSSDLWAPPLGPLLLPPVGLAGARSITMDGGEVYLRELRVAALSLVSAQTSPGFLGIHGQSRSHLPVTSASVLPEAAGSTHWLSMRRAASVGTLTRFVCAAAAASPEEGGQRGRGGGLELGRDDESRVGVPEGVSEDSSGGLPLFTRQLDRGEDGMGSGAVGWAGESRPRREEENWRHQGSLGCTAKDSAEGKNPMKLFGSWI